jgi:DNA repair exonuclease SbcCD nuclease subunit
MRLVHTADLHLGYRAYHRTDHRGVNIREADVARAFRELLSRCAEIAPELLLIAGDVFHTVRPSNAAIADAFRQFSHFRQMAPATRVVIIAGNHDSPKAVETGSILRLFAEIEGISVVHQEAKRLVFPELDTALLCLPAAALAAEQQMAIEPHPKARHNILLAHAKPPVDDERFQLLIDFGALPLRMEALDLDDWTYIGLGHYHIRGAVNDRAFYPGAIERTGLNIWAEADNRSPAKKQDPWRGAAWGKGFIEYDAESRHARFHTLESPRPVLDLDPILDGDAYTPQELNERIEAALDAIAGGIAGKIIRLRAFNVPHGVYREIDHRRVREYRTEALHFHLDVKPPRVVRREGSAAPGRRLSLPEELSSFLRNRWKPESRVVDREALIELGLRYLKEAEERESVEGRE